MENELETHHWFGGTTLWTGLGLDLGMNPRKLTQHFFSTEFVGSRPIH